MVSAAKVDTSGFTPGGYIDAHENAGFMFYATIDPEGAPVALYTGLPQDPNKAPPRIRKRAEDWQRRFNKAGAEGRRAVIAELIRRGKTLTVDPEAMRGGARQSREAPGT